MGVHSKAQLGLRRIELATVVLILTVLLAAALPRLMSFGSDARKARLRAVLGSVEAATQITRAAALVAGGNALDHDHRVTQDGVTVATAFGYPKASAAGIVRAAGIDPAADRIGIAVTGTTVTFAVLGAHVKARCGFTYAQSTGAATPPAIGKLDFRGC